MIRVGRPPACAAGRATLETLYRPMQAGEIIQFQQVTKLSAARRQLAQAIRLFLAGGDELAVHTLAAAAHGILHDLGKRKGTFSLKTPPFMNPELTKEWVDLLHGAQNFLKHANNDPDRVFEYNERQSFLFLIDATFLYVQLTRGYPTECAVFLCWLWSNHPELLAGDHPVIASLRSQVESKGARFKDREGWSRFLGGIKISERDMTIAPSGAEPAGA